MRLNICLGLTDFQLQSVMIKSQRDPEGYDEFYGLAYGREEYSRDYNEAYREAFLLACGEAVYESLWDQDRPGYGITRPAYMPTIFMCNVWSEIFEEEELFDHTSKTEHIWFMKYNELMPQMQNVSKVPMTMSSIQAGIAMLTLQNEFRSEEHEKSVRALLRRYGWITEAEATNILSRWRDANFNVRTMNEIGIYV